MVVSSAVLVLKRLVADCKICSRAASLLIFFENADSAEGAGISLVLWLLGCCGSGGWRGKYWLPVFDRGCCDCVSNEGIGPLSDPSISLPKFAAFACLPIEAAHEITDPSKRGLKSFWNYAAKALVMCLVYEMYGYTDVVHPKVTWVLYCLHIYCGLEIILAVLGGLAKAVIGIEMEPQFDEPYLSASLQDFWGRRWNMMVSKILRPSVYEHVLKFSTRITGRRWAALPAVIATFFVSGLMHELIFYYMGCWRPSGALTALLMVHGVCMAAEVAVKKVIKGRWRLPWLLTWLLTSGFLMATATWLFIPELLRCNVIANASDEYAALWAFVKDVTTYYTLPIPN